MPFICIAPSPTSAITVRSGCAYLAAIAYGTPGPMVASPPESEAMHAAPKLEVACIPVGGGAGIAGQDAAVRQARRQLPEHALRIDRIGAGHGATFQHAPPAVDVLFNLLAPAALILALQIRYQRAQSSLGVADQANLHRIAQVQHAAVDVDLHAARLAFLRQEFRIRKRRADHQQGVAVAHQVPARFGAEQADRARDEGQIVRHRCLAQQCLGDAGTEQLGGFDHFVGRRQRTGADQHRHFLAGVQYVGRALQVAFRRHAVARGIANPAMHGAVFARRRFDRRHVLHVIRKNHAGDGALVARDAHRAVDQVTHLLRRRHHVHVLVRDVLEQGKQIHFLLVIAAERHPVLLADERHHRLMIHLGVVQAVQQMDRARPGSSQTDTDFSGEFCMGASHEGRQLLMSRLHELDSGFGTAEGADDAVDAVTRITVDSSDAPGFQAFQQEIAHGCRHVCPHLASSMKKFFARGVPMTRPPNREEKMEQG